MFVTVHKNARPPSLLASLRASVKGSATPKAEKTWQTVFPLKPKSNHERLANSCCPPEGNEGSLREMLRYAQNDTPEGLHHKVYECSVV